MKGKAPNKEEKQWLSDICELGCIVCLEEMGIYSPAMPHHMDGKTKPGAHFKTIPLCHQHHQSGRYATDCVSRHPYKAMFEKIYGTEEELLQKTRERLET